MKREFKKQIIDLLNEHRIMTIATNRPDGWPQATVVGYCNDGMVIYCLISRDSQKYANIMRDGHRGHRPGRDRARRADPAASLPRIPGDAAARPRRGADHSADAGDCVRARLFQGLRPYRSGPRQRQRPCRIHRGAPASLGGVSSGLKRASSAARVWLRGLGRIQRKPAANRPESGDFHRRLVLIPTAPRIVLTINQFGPYTAG